jgi:hypothetical protein
LEFNSRVKAGVINEKLSTTVMHRGAKGVGHAQSHA